MKITVLNENMVYKKNLFSEHGLSVLIETDNKKLLMDTGQSNLFIKNANTLGVNLNDLDGIIISHGHYDHGGGLKYLNELDNIPNIYITKKALLPKYSFNNYKQNYYFNGLDYDKSLENHFFYTSSKEEIFKGIHLISDIPYINDFESYPKGFYIKKNENLVMDLMNDEQVLVIETSKGLSVFMGCAHMGVINALSHIKRLFKGKKIYSLFAGMHLSKADKERVDKTISSLQKENIQYIMPCHCSGYKVIAKMSEIFNSEFIGIECGKVIEI